MKNLNTQPTCDPELVPTDDKTCPESGLQCHFPVCASGGCAMRGIGVEIDIVAIEAGLEGPADILALPAIQGAPVELGLAA